MKNVRSLMETIKTTYTFDEKMILLVFTSLFMPWWYAMAVISVCALYIFVKTDFMRMIKEVKGGSLLIGISLYCVLTSILNGNWYGLAVSIFMVFMFILTLHYRKHINSKVFQLILDIAIVLSLVSVVYGIFEQFYYMSQIDGMGFLDIQNKPQYRVHTFYYNANYYALVILFIECMCIYKFFINENLKLRIYYTLAGVANLFAMFLTGGRIAWLGLAVGVITMVFVNRWWKTLGAVIVAGCGAVGVLALKPGLIPRLASRGFKLERRKQIWQAAWLMIQDHGLFGGGPMAYYSWYEGYKDLYIETYGLKSFKQYKLGISAPHSHTMFLEPFISFGIVGTILILGYLCMEGKKILSLITKKIDYTLASFIIGCTMVTLSFCIMDFPILWHQTGFLLLMVLGSADIYREEIESC